MNGASPSLRLWAEEMSCNLSHSEEPKPEHRIRGTASPMPSATGGSLSWSCWPQFLIQARMPIVLLLPPGHTPAHVQLLLTSTIGLFSSKQISRHSENHPHSANLHGILVTQVQDPTHDLIEPHQWPLPIDPVCPDPSVVPPTQLGVVCKLAESTLHPLTQS